MLHHTGLSNFVKLFSKFCRRDYDLISKFNVGLKSLLKQGLSELEFYGDLVYKLKKKEPDTALVLCDRLHAWLLKESRSATLLPSLIARRRVRPQT